MGSLRRWGGATVLLLATAGFACCVAGIVGSWILGRAVSGRVLRISAGLDAGLQRGSSAVQSVLRAVEKARADLAQVDKDSAEIGGSGEKGRRASRSVRSLVQQRVGPRVEDLGGRLATLSDTAVAVSSLLQSFEELPPGRIGRINADQLGRWADQAQQLSTTFRRLEGVVGDGDKETSRREVAAATTDVNLVLQRCQATLEDWQSDLEAALEQLPNVKAQTLGWLKIAVVAVTVLSAWMAVGQVSLFARALQSFKVEVRP
jgi:hypothetical protein